MGQVTYGNTGRMENEVNPKKNGFDIDGAYIYIDR
jgi:hypothetical protein